MVDYGVRWESPPLPHPLCAAAHHPQYEDAPGGPWAGLLGLTLLAGDSLSVVTSPLVPLLPILPGFCAPLSA